MRSVALRVLQAGQRLFRRVVLHGLLWSVQLAGLAQAARMPESEMSALREQAVQVARSGRLADAIQTLQALAAISDDVRIAYDLTVVLQWAGQSREALQVLSGVSGSSVDSTATPDYVLAAIAHAQRDLQQFAEAEKTTRVLLVRSPGNAEWTQLLARVLIDQQRFVEARALMASLLVNEPNNVQSWLVLGYAARRANDPFAALRAYGEVLRLAPGQPDAKDAMSTVLRDLGAPFAAGTYPDVSGTASLALRAQQAAVSLRWAATVTQPKGTPRFAATDLVLARFDALMAEARAAGSSASDVLTSLRRDHVLALRQREHWADALLAVQALQADGITLPDYVRQAQADALLALRRPAEARRIYTQLIAGRPPSPVNRNAWISRFYAEVEDEDFDAAFASVDTLAAQGSAGRINPGTGRKEENINWLSSQVLAGQARNYGDVQAQAWARLEPLAEAAPALGYLRSALAAVAASRGWPRRAELEIEVAASLVPEDRGVWVGLADSALRRRDAQVARRISADLLAQSPGDLSVQRLARDIALGDKAEVRLDVAGSRERGNALSSSGGGLTVNARLRSGPLSEFGPTLADLSSLERWRLQAVIERSSARPSEGLIVRRRVGAGAVYAGPDIEFELMGWADTGVLQRSGASVDVAWQLSDQWSVYLDAERFARDAPLRALFYGITADAIGAGVQYRWHESRSLLVGTRQLRFSDGNQRTAQRVVFSQRLFDAPHFNLTLRPEYFASQNSRPFAPYFNPARDTALTLTLEAEHMLYRRYERSWVQRLRVSSGRYAQSGFASAGIGSVAYEQVFRFDPALELRGGVEVGRRVYDGRPERQTNWFIGATKRF